jgi:hypothetical protein
MKLGPWVFSNSVSSRRKLNDWGLLTGLKGTPRKFPSDLLTPFNSHVHFNNTSTSHSCNINTSQNCPEYLIFQFLCPLGTGR